MISHRMRLFCLLSSMCLFASGSRGEIVKDCDLIRQAREYKAINPQLVLAVAEVESSKDGKVLGKLDPRNVHYGLMQLKLGTARMLGFKGHPKELLNWKTNLKIGIKYLDEKLEKHNSMKAAAAAYNAGAPFKCKPKHVGCKMGEFVNQGYVDLVMSRYKRTKKVQCGDIIIAGS